MARIDLDLDLFVRQARAKAAHRNQRQRDMIGVYVEHGIAEVAGEMDRLMATMIPEPVFHIWIQGRDIGPKGRDAVEAMYKTMFDTRNNCFEMDLHRVTVDDDAIVKEFTQRRVFPGSNLASAPMAQALRATGEEVDPDAHYLSESRVLATLPFDDRGLMIGEDVFTAGFPAIRKLSADELPEAYLARL